MTHDEKVLVDVSVLERHEAAIERGLQTFIEVGLHLAAIRDNGLYRTDYATFEEYVEGRWNFSDRRARQLIAAAGVVAALPDGTIVPGSESQARELAGLTPQQSAIVMRVAHENTGGTITASAIGSARVQPWTDVEINVAIDGYQIHPAIACWPAFKPHEWQALSASIGRWLHQRILISPDGATLLDGRFRYLALRWNGIDPQTATTSTGQPALERLKMPSGRDEDEYTWSVIWGVNACRKHYTAEELAALRAARNTIATARCNDSPH